jgi:hypothetical protein
VPVTMLIHIPDFSCCPALGGCYGYRHRLKDVLHCVQHTDSPGI